MTADIQSIDPKLTASNTYTVAPRVSLTLMVQPEAIEKVCGIDVA
jgi:hypothetical protein